MIFEKLKLLWAKAPPTQPLIIQKPSVSVAKQTRQRFVEFGAGFGDVVTLMYTSDRYNSLEHIGDEDVTVVLMCHNPFVRELFQWHPNADRLKIMDLGFWWPKEDAERRAFHKLPPAQPFVYQVQKSCRFYPSPEDIGILQYLYSLNGYVLINASAGGLDRNIPSHLCERSIDVFLEAGYTVVVIGRTYGENRAEVKIADRPNVVNLIDCLSIPGTALAIEKASGVFCCHSSVSLLSWHLRRPVFLLYPEDVKKRDFHSVHQYTIGKDFPTTMHMEFSEYSVEKARRFISIMGGKKKL